MTSIHVAASKSKERNAKDKNRRDKGACLGSLHIGDRVLVRNSSEHGGTGSWSLDGKMKFIR